MEALISEFGLKRKENGWCKMIEDITKVKVDKIERMCETLKKKKLKEVSFELVIGSLFPDVYKNIKEELRRQYTLGYSEGLRGGKDD